MKYGKKLALILMLVFTAALLGGCSSNGNVGVIDSNKVLADSPKIKQFQEQLNAKGKEISDQLDKDKTTLSPDDFQKRQKALYEEYVKTQQDLEAQIESSIKQTVEGIAKDKKLSIVLYKSNVVQGGTDITDEVIKQMQ